MTTAETAPATDPDGPVNASNDNFGRQISLIIAAIALGVGVILRIFRLDFKGLWLDEVFTIFPLYASSTIKTLFSDFLIYDLNSPLFSLIILGWTNLFGYSDAAVRSPSAVFGILAIIGLYIVLRWSVGSRVAVTGTILIAFSWPAIHYAQELRNYSFLLLLSVLATGVWLKIVTQSRAEVFAKLPFWLLLLLAPILSFIHLYGFILAASLWIHLGVAGWCDRAFRNVRMAAVGFAGTCLFFFPWLSINLIAAAKAGYLHLTHIERPGLSFFIDIGAFMYHHPIPAVLLAVVPVAMGGKTVLGRIRGAARSRNLREPFVALLCITVIPFLAVFIFSQVKPILYTRYLMVFVPGAIIFIAMAFDGSTVGKPWQRHLALLVAAFFTLTLVLPDYYKYRWKPQTREAAQWILERLDPKHDAIIAPCFPEPTYSCDYKVGMLSSRVSRYIHYLNYQTLPQFPLRPDLYYDEFEVGQLLSRHNAREVKTIFLIGSRKHLALLPIAKKVFENEGLICREAIFFLSTVYRCERAS